MSSGIAKDSGVDYKQEHGTAKSYVVGFVLSLVFTFIPYFMVVNQTVTGTALLLTIMVFALIQLLVQVVFFLHLGRGPKPNWNLFFFLSTVGIILVVVGGSIFIINNLVYNMLPSDQAKQLIEGEGIYQVEGKETGACYGQHTDHKLTIYRDRLDSSQLDARSCDTLIFINETGQPVTVLFGGPMNNYVYAGESQINVRTTRTNSVKLSEVGTYTLYVAEQPDLRFTFTVTED